MGFTPLEGMMMGTRPGSIDCGILLHLLERHGLSAKDLDQVLNHRSGLLGVSGVSSDIREVEAAARHGNERAKLALDIYADRIRQVIGALTTTLGGLDALVFTAGVGEHDANLRADVCTGLQHLGLNLEPQLNSTCQPDQDVGSSTSRVRVLVIYTREELMIARETKRVAVHR
jgi:acetate kinase